MEIGKEIKQSKFKNEYQKMLINILFTSGWLSAKHNSTIKPFGISTQQFNLLRILRGQHPKPATVNLLIDRMLDKNSNASRLVEKLRVKGLVERKTSEDDRRACEVNITKKGMDLLTSTDKQNNILDDLFSTLTEEEIKQLARCL